MGVTPFERDLEIRTGITFLNAGPERGLVIDGIQPHRAIRRGTFRSVKELTTAIGAFIDAYTTRCQSFAWTKTSEDILTRAGSQRSQPT
jgi:hypothetical protein